MPIIIPEGKMNATFIMTVAGSARQFTTAVGLSDTRIPARDFLDVPQEIYDIAHEDGAPWGSTSMATSYTFQGVSITKTVDGEPVVAQYLVPAGGMSVNDALPPNCAQLVRKVTAAGGRHGRGRFYMPISAPPEDFVDAAGFFSSTILAALNAEWEQFRADLVSADYLPFLFHSDATPEYAIQSFSVQNQIATQRRRMR